MPAWPHPACSEAWHCFGWHCPGMALKPAGIAPAGIAPAGIAPVGIRPGWHCPGWHCPGWHCPGWHCNFSARSDSSLTRCVASPSIVSCPRSCHRAPAPIIAGKGIGTREIAADQGRAPPSAWPPLEVGSGPPGLALETLPPQPDLARQQHRQAETSASCAKRPCKQGQAGARNPRQSPYRPDLPPCLTSAGRRSRRGICHVASIPSS